jgi:hypothetical protein
MASRLQLHEELCKVLGSRNVYFNPPSSVKMKYPAIVYSLDSLENTHANNSVYSQRDRYSITYIDTDPDNSISRAISKLPLCRFGRFYISDNLNHYTYTIYY